MTRLPAFSDHRFIGTRDDMRFHDCDDPAQFAELARRVEDDGLVERNRLQSFSPDEPAEARNRGFRAL